MYLSPGSEVDGGAGAEGVAALFDEPVADGEEGDTDAEGDGAGDGAAAVVAIEALGEQSRAGARCDRAAAAPCVEQQHGPIAIRHFLKLHRPV